MPFRRDATLPRVHAAALTRDRKSAHLVGPDEAGDWICEKTTRCHVLIAERLGRNALSIHYGIARVALATNDLEGDMAKLEAAGAEFISEPAQMPASSGVTTRFVCFKDPDGTVLELVENLG